MVPFIHLNYSAVFIAALAQMVIGFLWFGPIFGKVWAREMCKPADFRPSGSEMLRATVIQLVAAFLIAWVLAHVVNVWRPSVWGVGQDGPAWTYGFYAGFFVWLGFFVPLMLSALAWGGRTWKLFFIDAAGNFILLQVSGMILAFWR